jgi:hypothetical protein
MTCAGLAEPFQSRDFELLHHWATSTCQVVGLNHGLDRERIWKTVVPRLAQGNPFLLYIVLATTASHLSTNTYQSDPRRYRYRRLALHHHVQATSHFRYAITHDHERPPSESAILPFGILTMFTSLALLPATKDSRSEELDDFVRWLVFTRHSVAFAMSYTKSDYVSYETTGLVSHLQGGDLSRAPKQLTATDQLPGSLVDSLDRLSSLIASSPSLNSGDVETLLLAIAQTKLWFRLVPPHPQNHTYLMLWVGSMTEAFFVLVASRSPHALALMAHWLVPLYHAPKLWFISDWPQRMILAVLDELTSVKMNNSIEWVMREVKLDVPQVE